MVKNIICSNFKVKKILPLGKKILTLPTRNLKIIFHENNNKKKAFKEQGS